MLPNPGQSAIENGKSLVQKAEEHEAIVNPGLTADQRNELFLKHEEALKAKNSFRAGDIVKLAPCSELIEVESIDSEEEKEVLMLVLKAGQEAMTVTQDFGRDVILNFVNKEGNLNTLALGSRFLTKVRSFNQKK